MENDRSVFEETVVNALMDNQYIFYAHIIASTVLNIDNKFPAPAGVAFIKGQFHLFLNMEMFKKYTLQERKGILVHEALHIVLNHTGRVKNKRKMCWNMAADIAINQFIKDLPEGALLPSQFSVEEKLSAENYYAQLRKKMDDKDITIFEKDGKFYAQVKDKNGTKTYEIDPHSGDDKSDDSASQEMIEMIRDRIVEHAEKKSRGNIPSDIAEEIAKMRSKKVNWKRYIKNELSNPNEQVEETIKRRNRRFYDRIEVKGFQKQFSASGIVIMDTSGSVPSDFIANTVGELTTLSLQLGCDLKLIQVDTEVKEVKEFNPKSNTFKIKGRGGTFLYPAVEYINKNKLACNFIVVITDGECEDNWPIPPKIKTFFLLPQKANLNLNISNMKAKVFNI
jgi:predicted metal-dependent peptidase